MLNYFLEATGMLMLFFGMCMEECQGAVFILQIVILLVGVLLMFVGFARDRLKYERRQTEKRIAEMKRRMRESA